MADSRRTKLLYRDGHVIPRHVFPEEDVRLDLLPPEAITRHEERDDILADLARDDGHRTTCAYKGQATHWDAAGERAIAWSYELPLNDAMPVRSMIAFYNERVDIEVDGQPEERPRTQWAPGS